MDRESVLSMDPNILLSMVNMKLRDFYSNLSALCEEIGVTEEELKEKLNSIGYKYKRDQNQFK
ncbi:DUF4250 domain-containing protein [Clostridium tertium]|jgi:thermostable 8-oxoguanine DNA glycosylase|uniref:DUF4250 domain-containing protein n=1 Tax=Clostridium tertium TaxID=1559 RepID=A0A9X3XK66_9CLOT|nr:MULTISPECIES: DUF4250 domain-containing protein [Clostridium]MBU6135981.1 DUF4250 domain-containing protein [Clostridium tertium]MDB1924285.1 DUF4250 domain-containing protein [Clostridium tertium]MDB1927476.1 DUF4250 domain-containing protein [Clostridium tertium]MDB1931167.1 DUF4250 domain-containing protein [Clostridium tertium]MDB1932191.1 DUF4250 domain-containing protein [Clostridium tertium]